MTPDTKTPEPVAWMVDYAGDIPRPERSLHFNRPEPTPLTQASALYAVDVPRVVRLLEDIHDQARHAPLEDMASALCYIEKVAARALAATEGDR